MKFTFAINSAQALLRGINDVIGERIQQECEARDLPAGTRLSVETDFGRRTTTVRCEDAAAVSE